MKHRMLAPLRLEVHDLQALKEVAAPLEVTLQGGAEHALTETARTAHEHITAFMDQLIDQGGLVYIQEASLPDLLKGLYARRQPFQFVSHTRNEFLLFTVP